MATAATMGRVANPAWESFVRNLGESLVFGEVIIRRQETGYELRHHGDDEAAHLRQVGVPELRALAQRTESGAFRPLKTAPTLQRGWRCYAKDDEGLESALHSLYPGAVADWFAAQSENPPITHYRPFTARQTGMYRITTKLSNDEVAKVIQACCQSMCLRRRLWTVEGVLPDTNKSLIPCLEPCAILLEAARTLARALQAEKTKS